MKADLRVTDNTKVSLTGGVEQVTFNDLLGNASKTTSSSVSGVHLTYQPNPYNQLNFGTSSNSNSQTYNIGYAHKLNNNLETFVELSHTKNT